MHAHAQDGTTPLDDRWNTSTGSIGICLDSAQHFIKNGGCCYQNMVRGGHIGNVRVGVYFGYWANGNQVKDIMMNRIGKYAYHLVNASENTVLGGFVSGSATNLTIIRSEDSMFNIFLAVSGEPGRGSTYFNFSGNVGKGMWNTVIGHDNTYDLAMECWKEKDNYAAGHAGVGCRGPEVNEVGFTWIDSPFGIHVGDYNGSKIDVSKTLQVEGNGYIRHLEHGLPVRRQGLGNHAGVEAVDEVPILLASEPGSAAHTIRISGLGLANRAQLRPKAAYYEVTVSGTGWPTQSDQPLLYTARYLLTPWCSRSGDKTGVAVEVLAESASFGSHVVEGGETVLLALAPCDGEREIVVDVRKVGRECLTPSVALGERLL
jgi:hypothetical protein